MTDECIKPTNTDNRKKLNNMLGASNKAIIIFYNKRKRINEKDMGTLIGFNYNASLNLEKFFLVKLMK